MFFHGLLANVWQKIKIELSFFTGGYTIKNSFCSVFHQFQKSEKNVIHSAIFTRFSHWVMGRNLGPREAALPVSIDILRITGLAACQQVN